MNHESLEGEMSRIIILKPSPTSQQTPRESQAPFSPLGATYQPFFFPFCACVGSRMQTISMRMRMRYAICDTYALILTIPPLLRRVRYTSTKELIMGKERKKERRKSGLSEEKKNAEKVERKEAYMYPLRTTLGPKYVKESQVETHRI